jgi:hypothetical protein
MTDLAPPARCDGCGTETSGATKHTSADVVTVLGTYCPGCEQYRQLHDIEPGEHEQHELLEAI